MDEKERLDICLVERGFAPSREVAKAYIMAGKVLVDNVKETKAGTKIKKNANISLIGEKMKYVSRGGYKLEKAMDNWDIDLKDKVCMDVGASTGGFTDCMLQNGAKKVYSVDVGYGQFAWSLRTDERVVCLEKTNIRYLTDETVKEKVSFVSIDVSFISLTKVIPPAVNLMADDGKLVCLIKPQFEAGKENVGKKGVVKDKKVHSDVIKKIIDFSFDNNLNIRGISYSPIKGPEGNIEYLIFLDRKEQGLDKETAYKEADNITEISHNELDK